MRNGREKEGKKTREAVYRGRQGGREGKNSRGLRIEGGREGGKRRMLVNSREGGRKGVWRGWGRRERMGRKFTRGKE